MWFLLDSHEIFTGCPSKHNTTPAIPGPGKKKEKQHLDGRWIGKRQALSPRETARCGT